MADVSESGAKLKLIAADVPVPPTFILRVSQRDARGKPCALRWRRGASLGVQFLMPSISKRTYNFSQNDIDRSLKHGRW
jgi:hypothetical protein